MRQLWVRLDRLEIKSLLCWSSGNVRRELQGKKQNRKKPKPYFAIRQWICAQHELQLWSLMNIFPERRKKTRETENEKENLLTKSNSLLHLLPVQHRFVAEPRICNLFYTNLPWRMIDRWMFSNRLILISNALDSSAVECQHHKRKILCVYRQYLHAIWNIGRLKSILLFFSHCGVFQWKRIKAFHGVAPNRSAFFSICRSLRCGTDFLLLFSSYGTVQFGKNR